MRSLPTSIDGLPRFDMRPQGDQQVVHAPEQAVMRVSVGPDHFALVWTRDGWDASRVCDLHHWASIALPAEDRLLCSHCPVCEWERWLTSPERDRGLKRFDEVSARLATSIELGSQGHGH